MKLDIIKILQLMPHRYPILLVDRVLELEPGVRISAIKNVSSNEPFFQGHFPGHPVMPGVLIIEALAQAAAVLTYVTMKTSYPEGTLFLFAGIDGARFKRPVGPGDQLRLDITMDRVKRGVGKFTCRALVDGDVVCEAELMCALHKAKEEA
jgi:3-hydroxyacyl-[acyl-carrier-protein] dehydratase